MNTADFSPHAQRTPPYESRTGSACTWFNSVHCEHLKMIFFLSVRVLSLKLKICWVLLLRSKRQLSLVMACSGEFVSVRIQKVILLSWTKVVSEVSLVKDKL